MCMGGHLFSLKIILVIYFISLLQFLFQQLGLIIATVKQHIRNYLDDIFELIKVNRSHVIHRGSHMSAHVLFN